MNEIIQKNGSNRSETKAIFAHQVIVRHRSPVLAEKIRQEERKAGGKKRAITILLPDLDFNVALVLLEFMYTDDVFTRLLPGEDLVRDIGLYCTCWWYSLCNFQYRQHCENTCWDHVE